MNIPAYGDEFRRINAHLSTLKVTAQLQPDMTVSVTPGGFWLDGEYIEFAGGSSPTLTPPSTGGKFVVVCLNKDGEIELVDGQESTVSPALPKVDSGLFPLAAVYLVSTTTVVTDDMIFDVRGIFNAGYFKMNHNDLDNRDASDAHPISAITNLQAELDSKIGTTELNAALESKADIDGTDSTVFTLNKDQVGAPVSDVMLNVERGSMPNVGIRYNETLDRWQFTNDGATWYDFSNIGSVTGASTGQLGLVRISVDPPVGSDPIAVETTDPRLFSVAEKANIVNHLADHTDPHNTLHENVITTDMLIDHSVTWDKLSTTLQSTINNKADLGHTHTSTDITDFDEAAQDAVGTTYISTTTIDALYDDANNRSQWDLRYGDTPSVQLTVNATGLIANVKTDGTTILVDSSNGLILADGAVTDAKVATSANIAWTKIDKTGGRISDLDVPTYAGHANQVLRVNSAADGVEWTIAADELVKVGASGTPDFLNDSFFEQDATEHIRPVQRIDDTVTATDKLWSSNKIQAELNSKSDVGHTHVHTDITDQLIWSQVDKTGSALTDIADVSAYTGNHGLVLAVNSSEDGTIWTDTPGIIGTPSATFTLNTDVTGSATEDVIIEVNRGSDTNVQFKWDETDDRWSIDQDLIITDNSKGVILVSPSGNKFRIVVDDSGSLSTTAV